MVQRQASCKDSQVDTHIACSNMAICRPRKSGLKFGAPPPYEDGLNPDVDRQDLKNKLQRARREIRKLRYQLNASPPTLNCDQPNDDEPPPFDDDGHFAFGNNGNRPFQTATTAGGISDVKNTATSSYPSSKVNPTNTPRLNSYSFAVHSS